MVICPSRSRSAVAVAFSAAALAGTMLWGAAPLPPIPRPGAARRIGRRSSPTSRRRGPTNCALTPTSMRSSPTWPASRATRCATRSTTT